jgi:superfamily II DNA or RNA helicase
MQNDGGPTQPSDHPRTAIHTLDVRPTNGSLILRPYQHAGLAAIEAALERGVTRQCLVWPTGAGKTIVFAVAIARRGGRALVLVHRDELVQQTIDKFHLIAPDLRVGVVKAERNELDADVVVASVQTVSREARLRQLFATFDTVVVDEAHHAVAETYQRIIDHLTADTAPLLLGVTATPDRLDKLGLQYVFDEIVHQVGLLELMHDGYLTDVRALRIRLSVDLSHVTRRNGDLAEGELAEVLSRANAPRHVANAYLEHARDRSGVVFTPSVALAHETATALSEAGISAEALDGTTPIEARRAMLRRLATGQTQVLANCMVLTEGFDEPRVACIVNARPTESRALYQQMIGRGLRPYPGKTDCLVLDLVANSTRHELVTAASLFGLDPNDVATVGVLEAEVAATANRRRRGAVDVDGELVAETVDLLASRPLAWLQLRGTQVYALELDDRQGYVYVEPSEDGLWSVLFHPTTAWGTTLQSLHAGVAADWALGLGESYARQHSAPALLMRNLYWRSKPPSDQQASQFMRMRWPLPMTRGEAKDYASRHYAEQAWRRARR